MLNIEPIKLLRGCHEATGRTGQGCFLNVCSYLQGDTVITDKPSSVIASLRKPLIILNDYAPNDEQRQRLIPLVYRAMLTGATEGAQRNTLDMGGAFLIKMIGSTLSPFADAFQQQTFEVVLGFVDALLPKEQEPPEEIAKRAADLALARAAWGDAPVPAEKSKAVIVHDEFSFFTSSLNDATLKKMEQLVWNELAALPPVDFAKHVWSAAIAPKSAYPKPNTPHGPIKHYKPAYF